MTTHALGNAAPLASLGDRALQDSGVEVVGSCILRADGTRFTSLMRSWQHSCTRNPEPQPSCATSCVTPDISPSTRSASRRERTSRSRCGRFAGATAGNGANGLHSTSRYRMERGH